MVMGCSQLHREFFYSSDPRCEPGGSGRDLDGHTLTADEETKVCRGEGALRHLSGRQGFVYIMPLEGAKRRL